MKIQFNSRTDILSKVIYSNERNRFINIIAPPLSGKSQLMKELILNIQIEPRSLFIKIKTHDFFNSEILFHFKKVFKNEYDIELQLPEEGILVSESLYSILKQINSHNVNYVYLLIDDLNESSLELTYNILSQLRNLREKLSAKPLQINFCSVCIGVWKPSDLQNLCDKKYGSSFPLELFLCDYNFIEVKELLKNLPASKLLEDKDDYKINYLIELSGGCFSIIDYVLKNCNGNFNCSTIRDKAYEISKIDFFVENIEMSLKELSEKSKEIILKTLNNRIVKYENNIYSEELILSGLMKKKDLYGVPVLIIRSWIHEITIRSNNKLKNFIGFENILCDVNEIIPPTPSLNKMAYEIVLEIENSLRNFVVIFLAGFNNSDHHPLKIANELGKMREDWKKTTLYDELVYQKDKTINLYADFIDAYSSVSSFITVIVCRFY